MSAGLLDELSRVVGLSACALFGRDGACVAAYGEQTVTRAMMGRALERVSGALDVFRVQEARVDAALLVAQGTRGALVVRNVQAGAVVCVVEPSVNMAVLSVALDVVAAKRAQALTAAHAQAAPQPGPEVTLAGALPVEAVDPSALLDREIFRLVLNSFKRYVGPAAKVVLRTELAHVGLSVSAFPRAAYRPLMEVLARRIASPDKQGTFLAEVLHLAG